jgi:hypothetical protein
LGTLTFYFDRCLGTRFPEAIRKTKPPFGVEFQHDRKSTYKFRQDMPDDEWLTIAGQKDWIVFSHDRKFHSEASECTAIQQNSIGCFYLWGNNASSWEKLCSFARAYDKIVNAIEQTPRPFVYEVTKLGRLKRVALPAL